MCIACYELMINYMDNYMFNNADNYMFICYYLGCTLQDLRVLKGGFA